MTQLSEFIMKFQSAEGFPFMLPLISNWWLTYFNVYTAIMPVDKSAIVTSVWVFMTAKWTMMLFFFARRGIHDIETTVLVNPD